MKVLIGSYKENIYEVEIDNKKDKIVSNNKIIDAVKPSYIMEFNNLSYLYLKDNVIYVSFYHDGLLKVLSKKNNKWEISETLQYKDNSHIHYAFFIEDINLLGVCDLGDDKFFLYEYSNEHLNLVATYEFEEGVGPRHFVANGNLIYVINELKPSVSKIGRAHAELQSRPHLVCRLLLEKKNKNKILSILNFNFTTIQILSARLYCLHLHAVILFLIHSYLHNLEPKLVCHATLSPTTHLP